MRNLRLPLLNLLIVIVYLNSYGNPLAQIISRTKNHFQVKSTENAIEINFIHNGDIKLRGELGIGLTSAIGQHTECSSRSNEISLVTECFQWGEYAKLEYTSASDSVDNCARIEWTSKWARKLEDCFLIQNGTHWYGGGEAYRQHWPIEKDNRPETPMVTGDFFGYRDSDYGGVTENYWLLSNGVAINVDEDVPLFFSLNTVHIGKVCFSAQDISPYRKRSELVLKYSVCMADDIKSVHQNSLHKFYPKPTDSPDENMILYPIWSTWAQYKTEVNQSIVLGFAERIKSEGFLKSSHIEIDDDWESCYGEHEFNFEKFPNPAQMVQQIKNMGFNVTIWIHPFINFECPTFKTGLLDSYFVVSSKNKTGITNWWQGANSGIVDFTKEAAVTWWNGRLENLRQNYGIDSFKFDAGETNWLPSDSQFFSEDINLQPNVYSSKYVDAVATFGKLIEVRTGRKSQNHPIFTRMLDKDSNWDYENGLRTLIPTLLHFQILGYYFTLPDMIGGNAYGQFPSEELYIRWMQANVFMPAVQISIVPWHFNDTEVVQICIDMLALREQYKEYFSTAVNQAISDGSPINRPLWWVDPNDPITFTIDDEYLLGDDILVAPVLDQDSISRDIYLPRGQWISPTSNLYLGPVWLRNYSAPLDQLPYFIRYTS